MSSESAPPHVLVLDPDPAIRALLVAVLRRRQFRVTACACAESSAEQVRRGGYTMVMLSSDMPRLDALLHELRSADGARPRIVLTTTPHAMTHAARADAVLWKPFDLEELQAVIADATAPS